MKILFVAHTFPYPLDDGIKLMSYNLIKEFSKKNEVFLLSFINKEEKKFIDRIKNYCKLIEVVEHTIPRGILHRVYNLFLERRPFFAFQFFSKKFAQKLKRIILEEKPDVVHLDFIDTIIYRSSLPLNIPCIFFPHDAFSMYMYRNISAEKNLLRKLYTYLQYMRILNYEKRLIPQFDRVAVVSPVDRDWLKNILPHIEISVIPNGVDAEFFRQLDIAEENSSVIFRGNMSFLPNIDAVLYFYYEILPLIRKKIPDVKFYIVGKEPVKEIKKLANEHTIVTGRVEDLRPYIAKATVNVCPMRIGSGIKNKILEAMAMGKPTVATSVACEGIPDVTDGENILIADKPEEFAEKVILLLHDKDLRKKIGENSRKFVTEKYTWRKAAESFEHIYSEAIQLKKINKISIIVPAYNEVSTIEETLNRILKVDFGMEKEIVVVDDGSTDGTKDILNKLKIKNYKLKIVSHQKNQGKGIALRTGIRNSTGDVIAIQDADLEYNPEELKKLITPIIDRKTTIVYGSRFLQKNPTIYKRYLIGNKFLSWLISILYGYKITDSYTCYKIFHREVVKKINLTSKRFEIEAELTCKFLKNGYEILELPISYTPRSLHQGKKIKFKDAFTGLWTILKNKCVE